MKILKEAFKEIANIINAGNVTKQGIILSSYFELNVDLTERQKKIVHWLFGLLMISLLIFGIYSSIVETSKLVQWKDNNAIVYAKRIEDNTYLTVFKSSNQLYKVDDKEIYENYDMNENTKLYAKIKGSNTRYYVKTDDNYQVEVYQDK